MNTENLSPADVYRLTKEYDNINHFRERWGNDYRRNALDLWESVLNAYRNDESLDLTDEEIKFVAVFHYAVGGHLPSEDDPISFFKWIFEKL